WMEYLVRAHTDVLAAVATGENRPLMRAISSMKHVLGTQPSRINTRLAETVRVLRLPDLQTAMQSVRDALDPNGFSAESVGQFADGVEALAHLNLRLVTLIQEHDTWQQIDDDLRWIDDHLDPDLLDLEESWPRLKMKAETVCRGSTEPW